MWVGRWAEGEIYNLHVSVISDVLNLHVSDVLTLYLDLIQIYTGNVITYVLGYDICHVVISLAQV